MKNKKFHWIDFLPSTLSTLLFISQIVIVAYIGAGLYVFSGLVFGMLPTFEFRKKGEVKKGKSYLHTTKLVDTGIYSIVRHPQYVTFMMFAIAGILLFQHWIIVLLGIPVIPLTFVDLLRADKRLVERFGDDYAKYMQRVPRANFALGIIRLFRKGREN
jgi:protein-S-isoprenylcysteine O-methyltransferase Ste14